MLIFGATRKPAVQPRAIGSEIVDRPIGGSGYRLIVDKGIIKVYYNLAANQSYRFRKLADRPGWLKETFRGKVDCGCNG